MNAGHSQRVSVVIPARNEEANIARVLQSLTAQPEILEIIVVDDQSEDRTPELLAELKTQIGCLQVIRLDSLPSGWLGKTHALAEGARRAQGEWLLFTDADTQHLPGGLSELLARAEREGAELLSVSPGQETPTWWEKAVIPLVYVELSRLFRFEDVSDPRSQVAAANGQYLLIRRDTYERVGGHAAVRSEILDDVALARLVKGSGGKLVFLPGSRWVRTRMYRRFGELWRGWSKNLYLLYAKSTGGMAARVASLWLLDALPVPLFIAACVYALVGHGGTIAILVAAGLLVLALVRHASYARTVSSIGFSPALAWYLAPGAALAGALLLSSMRAHVAKGSVEWKGRHYVTRGQA